MNREPAPNPPADLLARCLDTIPQSATQKINVPRPSPDAGSRKRLAWLTVAATVPVLTVLAILPTRLWQQTHQRVTADTLEYVRVHKTILALADSTPNQTRWNREVVTVTIMDAKRGVVIYTASPDTWQPVSPKGKQKGIWQAKLTLPDGKQYHFTNNVFSEGGWDVEMWQRYRSQWQQTAANGEHFFTWGSDHRGLKVESREDRWQGRPVTRIQVTKTLSVNKGEKVNDTSQVQRIYIDRQTNRTLAVIGYGFGTNGVVKKLLVTSRAEYHYDRRPSEEKYFDIEGFKTRAVFQ